MGLELAAGAAILGTGAGLYEGNQQRNDARRQRDRLMQLGATPYGAENDISSFLQRLQNPNQAFNPGQDALMQYLRSAGQPFDTSAQFAALAPLEARDIQTQVSQLRAGAGSLGQRFGGAMMT